jgi:hypothetical protein
MKIFDILNPFFHALSDGKLIRLIVAWVLRILAVIVALAGLLWFIKIVSMMSETHAIGFLLGCLLFALIGLAWGYLGAGLLTFRAGSIAELEVSNFTVLSILSILLRLNGELMFVTYALLGVGGCLFTWFAGSHMPGMLMGEIPLMSILGSISGSEGNVFLAGIILLVLMLLVAFVCIVLFYALAECTVVLVEIALNTRGLRKFTAEASLAPVTKPVAPPTQTRVEHPANIASTPRKCKNCGQPLDAGSTFCAECGTQAG